MIEKYYNRKKTMVIFYVISFVLIILGGCFSIYTITIESWKLVGMTLLVAAIGLLLLIGIFNKHNDVIINYENNEVIVNIKFNRKEKVCIPFDAIVDVYIYNSDQLKQNIKIKKYPKQTIVIERKYNKEFIPIDWFGFVLGGLVIGYVSLALPLWFKKPNPVIFVPCSLASIILYLFYVCLKTHGNWFLTFALPVWGGLSLIICAIVTLLHYLKRGRLYIFGGAMMLFGGLMWLIEFLLDITFNVKFIGWSIYPFIILFLLGGALIYLAINSSVRRMIERKLFF